MMLRRLTLGLVLVGPIVAAGNPAQAATGPANASTDAVRQKVEQRAEVLMKQGRNALLKRDNVRAIAAFDELLRLPPNKYSKDAQELIGVAKERNGQIAAARQEYELYLRLYPEGTDADRVRQRLASLSVPVAPSPMAAIPARESQFLTYGGIQQYYYHGRSQIDTNFAPPGTTTPTQTSVSATDQSALVTNVDVTSRYRTDRYDVRGVVRAMDMRSFLDSVSNQDRVTAAYVDLRDRTWDYSARAGRQPGNSGGVLGYFDGALLGVGLTPKSRLNLVGGKPVDFYTHYDKTFVGANMELGPFFQRWSTNLYVIKQQFAGMADRQAVGSEWRYFDERGSFFGLIDYDTLFRKLNIAMMQANWQAPGNNTIAVLADHRLSPTLQASNALIGQTDATLEALRQTMSDEEIRKQALALTATSDVGMVGLTHAFSSRWQLGGEVQASRISSTEAAGAMPATPGTGNIWTYTAQAIGTGLFATRDISLISASYIRAATYTGQAIALTNRALVQRWTFDSVLRLYRQRDNAGTSLARVTPSFRVGYRWRDTMTFEAEAGIERTRTDGVSEQEDTQRQFYSLGYRWDFGT